MSLRLRRGTDGERLAITPEAGELIFTTDTKTVFVGDGATQGGIVVSAGGVTLADLGDTNLVSVQDGDILGYNASASKWEATRYVATDITGSVFAKDSGVLVDSNAGLITGTVVTDSVTASGAISGNTLVGDLTGSVTGDVVGNVTGNVVGNSIGYHTGDVSGSLFAIDSSVMVDAINGDIFAGEVNTTQVTNTLGTLQLRETASADNNEISISSTAIQATVGAGRIILSDEITLTPKSTTGNVNINNPINLNKNDDPSKITFTRQATDSSAFAANTEVSRLVYAQKQGTDDSVAILSQSVSEQQWTLLPSPAGTIDYAKTLRFHNNGKLGINGTVSSEPDANLHVTGNVKISGGELLLGNMDTTARDALTPANGMIIYNTTDNKFQGYENGAWANLI